VAPIDFSISARNTGIGPDYKSANVRISKAFRFKADSPMRLEASADFANIFNRTNFAAVNEVLPVTVGATGILSFPDPLAAADYAAATNRLEGRRDRSLNQPLVSLQPSTRDRFSGVEVRLSND
jgi:hypothetical protein